jgi:hypothetical protein
MTTSEEKGGATRTTMMTMMTTMTMMTADDDVVDHDND